MQRRDTGQEAEAVLPAILHVACHNGFTDILTEFLPQDPTSFCGDETTVAICTLEHVVRNGKTQHYDTAVRLLEAVNSQFPDLENKLLYAKLLVDLKTKAAISQMFMDVNVDRHAVLDKYFDPDLCQLYSDQCDLPQPDLYSTIEEYSASLHAFARTGLVNLMESERQCLSFQRNHLLNPTAALHLHENLVAELREYLGEVRLHLPLPRVLQLCMWYSQKPMATRPVTEPMEVMDAGHESQWREAIGSEEAMVEIKGKTTMHKQRGRRKGRDRREVERMDASSPNEPTSTNVLLKLRDFSIKLDKLPMQKIPPRICPAEPLPSSSQTVQDSIGSAYPRTSTLDHGFLQEYLSDGEDLSETDECLLQMASKIKKDLDIIRKISGDDTSQDKCQVLSETATISLSPKNKQHEVSADHVALTEERIQEPEIDVEVLEHSNTTELSTSMLQTTRQQPDSESEEESSSEQENQRMKLRSHHTSPKRLMHISSSSPLTSMALEDPKAGLRMSPRKRKAVSYDETITPEMSFSESPVHQKMKLKKTAKRKVTFTNADTPASVEGQILLGRKQTSPDFLDAIECLETPTSKRRHPSEEEEEDDDDEAKMAADVEHLQIAHSEGSVEFEDLFSDGGSVEYSIQNERVVTQNKVHLVWANQNTEGVSKSKPTKKTLGQKWTPKVSVVRLEPTKEQRLNVQSTSNKWSKYAKNLTSGSKTSCESVSVKPKVITITGKGPQLPPRRSGRKNQTQSPSHPANKPSTLQQPNTWSQTRKRKSSQTRPATESPKRMPAALRRLQPMTASSNESLTEGLSSEGDVLDLVDAEEEATQPQSQYYYNAVQRVAHSTSSNHSYVAHSDGTSELSASEYISESTVCDSPQKKSVLEHIHDIPPH